MGFIPIAVAIAALVLLVLHIIQLRNLKAFLSRPGPIKAYEFERTPHIYWRMVGTYREYSVGR